MEETRVLAADKSAVWKNPVWGSGLYRECEGRLKTNAAEKEKAQ